MTVWNSPTKQPARTRKTPTTYPRLSLAVGSGLGGGRAGVCCSFRVVCKDASGHRRTLGGDAVSATLDYAYGYPSLDAYVMDNTDGSYTVSYTPLHASTACTLSVFINGTHLEGSPFTPVITAGDVETRNTQIFGRGLYDGQSGRPAVFTIQTRDSFGNRCAASGAKFLVTVVLSKSLVPEFEAYLKRYEPPVEVTDAGDGTHTCTFTPAQAGFYAIEVTRDSVPVAHSPYQTCIFNDSIAFPPLVVFYALHGVTPQPLPSRPAGDYLLLDGKICLVESDPPRSRQQPRQREWLHFIDLTHLMEERWRTVPIRSTGIQANPPAERTALAVDDWIVFLCHGCPATRAQHGAPPARNGGAALARAGSVGALGRAAGPIDEVRVLDLSEMDQASPMWRVLKAEGKPPNAVSGYAAAVWEGHNAILLSGGQDAAGTVLTDVWLLQMAIDAPCVWRALVEWPSSIFEGQGPSGRRGHTLTFLPPSKFYVFGGVDGDGNHAAGLYVFDMDATTWSKPVERGQLPHGRTGHSSCFIAERYLVIYGGTDSVGDVIETASVYDLTTSTWITVLGVAARTGARLVSRGGMMYLMGGADRKGLPVPPAPLCSECFPFAQTGALEFVGSREQAVVCKPGPRLQPAYAVGPAQKPEAMRNRVTVEAAFLCRSFQSTGAFSPAPLVLKADAAFKAGFGLFIQEHPCFKGDGSEGLYVHFWFGAYSVSGSGHVVCKIEVEKWTHVAGVYDGHELRLYLNGTLRDKFLLLTEGDEGEAHAKADVHLGGLPGKYAFDGYLDHVRIWNTPLDQDTIRSVLNTVSVGKVDGLVAQWTFSEGSGDQVIDSAQQQPRLASHGGFDRYAGGVELRRVQSSRPRIPFLKTAREELIDANFETLHQWRRAFEEREGRPLMLPDLLMAEQEILTIAKRLNVLAPSSGFFQEA